MLAQSREQSHCQIRMKRNRERSYFCNWSCSASMIWNEKKKKNNENKNKKSIQYRQSETKTATERTNLLGVADVGSFFSETIGSDLREKRRVRSHFGIRSLAFHNSVECCRRRPVWDFRAAALTRLDRLHRRPVQGKKRFEEPDAENGLSQWRCYS